MNHETKLLAIMAARDNNLLAITSACNLNCTFCSHYGNPPQVEVVDTGHIDFAVIKEVADFLDPQKKIVIGESMTRICEGEPLLHPYFKRIITFLREKFPSTELKITTNGSLLDFEMIDFLASVKPLQLNLSLNSISQTGRKKLMGDNNFKREKLLLLKKKELAYHGSIVAMPWIVGADDLEETIAFLEENAALTIRIFIPGYTKLNADRVEYDSEKILELKKAIGEFRTKYQIPMTLEPVKLNDLKAVVEGVIVNSPADKAGLKRDDQIVKVAGEEVFSRLDAFNKIYLQKNPDLEIKRTGSFSQLIVNKPKASFSGIVMNYDFGLSDYQNLARKIRGTKVKQVLFLTASLAEGIIKKVAYLLEKESPEVEIEVKTVENNFFGGSIASAGLLVVDDFRKAFNEINNLQSFDLVFMPAAPFDYRGLDLCLESHKRLAEEYNLLIEFID